MLIRFWRQTELGIENYSPKIISGTFAGIKGKFLNERIAFDIETSTGYLRDNEVYEFSHSYYKKNPKFYEDAEKISHVYVWQCAFNESVYMGRTLESFKNFTDALQCMFSNVYITIYVHNLSYEMQFLRNIFNFNKVFARKKYKPFYAISDHLIFRCSYFLTHMSLDNWAKKMNSPIKKAVGEIDYLRLKTPKTRLEKNDYYYSICDVLSMTFCLRQYFYDYKKVCNIPLSLTGITRKKLQALMRNNVKNFKKCARLLPSSLEEYTEFVNIFAGGFTHANQFYSENILKNVHNMDISSSYPAWMCLCKFPFTPFVDAVYSEKYFTEDYSFIIHFYCDSIESETWNTFLSYSKLIKCESSDCDNGRILRATRVEMKLINTDYEIFRKCYKIKGFKVISFKISKNEYLDDNLVKYIIENYFYKNNYKDREGYEEIYKNSKEIINAIYGIMVTREFCDEIVFNEVWDESLLTEEFFLDKINRKKNSRSKLFTAYQHGLWITGYARKALWLSILNHDKDSVYQDTDSDKFLNNHDDYFEKHNNAIEERWKKRAAQLGLKWEEVEAVDIKGHKHLMGKFESEPDYKKFITLGAKKYCYEDEYGKLHITVSGVKKSAVSQMKKIEDFKEDYVFDTEHTGKSLMFYNENQPSGIIWKKGEKDEWIMNEKYAIAAMPTTYKLGLSEDYILLILLNMRKKTELFDVSRETLKFE